MDVQIHLNQEGRASGDVTAYFKSEDMARAAMKRNKEDMEGRYINLSMDSVTATFNSNTSHNTEYCVKMSGVQTLSWGHWGRSGTLVHGTEKQN